MIANNITTSSLSVSPLSTQYPDNATTNQSTNRQLKEREALLLERLAEAATSQLNTHGKNSFGDKRTISTSSSLDNATATASSSALEGLKKFFLSKDFLYSLAAGAVVVLCVYSPLAALVGKIGLLNTLLVGGGVLLGSAVAYRSLLCLASYLKQCKEKAKKIPQTSELEEVEVPDPKGPRKMYVLHTVDGKKELAQVICTWNPNKNRYVLPDEFYEAEIWNSPVALDEKGTYVQQNGECIYLGGGSSKNG